LQAFEYTSAKSVAEVTALLSENGAGTFILSGGTDLLVQLREGIKHASHVIDIKSIPEVNMLSYAETTGLKIGAAVPCYRLWNDPAVAQYYPGLVDAFSLIGGMGIQGRASVGGNLCNASPAADTIPALIVHRAVCTIVGENGQREVPVEDFCTAPGKTVLAKGEFLVSIQVPPPGPGFGAHYLRFIPRNEMDIAVVGAGASVTLNPRGTHFKSAHIALGAVAPTPLYVKEAGDYLAGKEVSPETIATAAEMARAAARPIQDVRGTIPQRKHLSAVLTQRALEKAVERARAQTEHSEE